MNNAKPTPDVAGFFQDLERLKADLAWVNQQYPDDPGLAAAALRRLWEADEP